MFKPGMKLIVPLLMYMGACSNPTEPADVDLVLPAPVGPANFFDGQSNLQWSPDGQVIYHLPRLGHGVAEFNLESGESRMLVANANSLHHVLRMTQNGEFLFYSSEVRGPSSGHSISRISTLGGDPELLVEGAWSVFGISPDGGLVAWRTVTMGSLFVRDLAQGVTVSLDANGAPPQFISPDHTSLLQVSLGQGVSEMTVTTLTSGLVERAEDRVWDARWGAQGWDFAIAFAWTISIKRGISGASVFLWTAPTPGFIDAITWSPNGDRLAVSQTNLCFTAPCRRELIIIDSSTGSARTLVSRVGAVLGKPHFSPDGNRIAVISGDRLHVIPIP